LLTPPDPNQAQQWQACWWRDKPAGRELKITVAYNKS